jgi:hypothetical protein
MPLRRYIIVFASVVILANWAAPGRTQDDPPFQKQVGQWSISTRKADTSDAAVVTVTDAQGHSRDVNEAVGMRVEDAFVFADSRLILTSADRVAVIDLRTAAVVDEFYVALPVLSPTHRFIAFRAISPRWAEANALYLIYDVMRSRDENCMGEVCAMVTGRAVYPDENRRSRSYAVTRYDAIHDDASRPSQKALAAMHRTRSPLTWIADSRLAFLDCTYTACRVVLVNVERGTATPAVAARAVALPPLIDVSKLPDKANLRQLGDWIFGWLGATTTRPTTTVRVVLDWHPWMTTDYVDVTFAPAQAKRPRRR